MVLLSRRAKVALTAVVVLAPLVPAGLAIGPAQATDDKRAAKASRWMTHRVEYGDPKLRLKAGTGGRDRIVFDGRKGDRVSLYEVPYRPKSDPGRCDWMELTRKGRSLGKPNLGSYGGYWVLPRTDRYAFKVRRCFPARRFEDVTQLLKLRSHKVKGADGARVRLTRERGYVDAAVLRVPERGRWAVHTDGVRGTRWWVPGSVTSASDRYKQWFVPAGYSSGFGDVPAAIPDLMVRAGEPLRYLHNSYDSRFGYALQFTEPLRAGQRIYVTPDSRKHVRVSLHRLPATRETIQIGGAPLTTVVHRKPRPVASARVTTPTPRWVRLEVSDGGNRADTRAWVTGPGNAPVTSPTYGLVHLPAGTSTVWFGATDDAEGRGREVGLRLTPVTELPPMPADGTPVVYTSDAPGEWAVAPMTLPAGHTYRPEVSAADFTSTDPAVPAGWQMVVASHQDLHANKGCRDIGCGYEYGIRWFGTVDAWQPDADLPAADTPREGLVLLRPTATTRGRVTLRVTPTS
jgi:hypothetical protein